MRLEKEKVCLVLLKYIPCVCAGIMLLHTSLLLLGVTPVITELLVITLVSIMVITWSYCFKFCLIHRLASLYTISILWCCYIQRTIGFGIFLNIFRLFFLSLGIILITCILIKYAKNHKAAST